MSLFWSLCGGVCCCEPTIVQRRVDPCGSKTHIEASCAFLMLIAPLGCSYGVSRGVRARKYWVEAISLLSASNRVQPHTLFLARATGAYSRVLFVVSLVFHRVSACKSQICPAMTECGHFDPPHPPPLRRRTEAGMAVGNPNLPMRPRRAKLGRFPCLCTFLRLKSRNIYRGGNGYKYRLKLRPSFQSSTY